MSQPEDQATSPIAFDELSARCLGRIDFVEKVLATFTSRFREDLDELEQEMQSADGAALARLAHRMKGACSNIAAKPLLEQTSRIEELAKQDRFTDIEECVQKLQEEWARFLSSAEAYASSGPRGT